MSRRTYYVYIMASRSRVLYVGVTNDLLRRVGKHRSGHGSKFTARYQVNRLVHVEEYAEVRQAIRREKQLKSWRRAKKEALIERSNPGWRNLAEAS